jgi:predicted RecA/RadA family phage recombinase
MADPAVSDQTGVYLFDQGNSALRSDGDAVDVTVTKHVTKGDVVVADGFNGFAQASASSGEMVALEIALREFEFTVPAGVTANKGDILYVNASGTITTTTSDTPFAKVTNQKDANNVVWAVKLPQAA